MAIRTGTQLPRGIAFSVEVQCRRIGRPVLGGRGRGHQPGIVAGHLFPIRASQFARDGTHGEMLAPTICIIVELALQISGIDPGKARRLAAISFAGHAVAGEAGSLRPRIRATERDDLAGRTEAVFRRRQVAARQQDQEGEDGRAHMAGNRSGRARVPREF